MEAAFIKKGCKLKTRLRRLVPSVKDLNDIVVVITINSYFNSTRAEDSWILHNDSGLL